MDRVRIYDRKDAIPHDPEPGRYAVIDTMYFSTTLVELFEQGAERVEIVPKAYRRDPAIHDPVLDDPLVCGGKNTDYTEPADGFDFFNSPAYTAEELDVDERDVLLNSTNGGDAVHALMEKGVGDITVAAPANAEAAAAHLAEADTVHLVCAGNQHGRVAPEDILGAELLLHHLTGGLDAATRDRYADELRRIGHERYDTEKYAAHDREPPGLHQQDIERYVPAIDTSTTVPTLNGEVFIPHDG